MRVSVVMATYNGGRWITEQLDSIAAQTRPPDEMVISDDGSTDDTWAIVQRFDPPFPVTVLNGGHLGFVGNFSRAILATSGDLILPCDQDDWWEPTKVERMVWHAEHSDADLFVHDAWICDADLRPRARILKQQRLRGMPPTAHNKGCCMAFRRPVWERVREVQGCGFDNDLAARARRKQMVQEPLMKYRLHGDNTSAWGVSLDRIGPVEVGRGLVRRARRRLRESGPISLRK